VFLKPVMQGPTVEAEEAARASMFPLGKMWGMLVPASAYRSSG
jgi:hypothetical protein